jgi:hypothetical protein
MVGGIYLIKDDDVLVEMVEQQYDSEELLQGLLDKYPLLLAGDQINTSEPRQWLPITREKGIPDSKDGSDRWAVDHLFLDQDGIPTLVEVKRSSDTRIRREVVGQMLDYAANAVVYWPVESIRSQFEERCNDKNIDPEQELLEKLGRDDSEGFWTTVKANLAAGKIRMLFVADVIPPELQRIVEFLNWQMKAAEVLAIEIKQYVGEGHKTLVPRVVGQTAAAEAAKGTSREKRKWDEPSFYAELEARKGPDNAAIARSIVDWAKAAHFRLAFGEGARDGSLFLMYDYKDVQHWTVALWTYGAIEIQLQWMQSQPPFDQEGLRVELLNHLNSIQGVSIPIDGIGRRPSIRLDILGNNTSLDEFFDVITWMIKEIEES